MEQKIDGPVQGVPDRNGIAVWLGAKFIFRMREIFGSNYAASRRPPHENQVLTVVGFEPTYKNNVVLQDPSGGHMLLPFSLVVEGLRVSPVQESLTRTRIPSRDEALEFIRHADGPTLNNLLDEIREVRKGLDVNAAAELKVGDIAVCDMPGGRPQVQGRITKISGCRVTIQMLGSLPNFICLPASMVRVVQASSSRPHAGLLPD